MTDALQHYELWLKAAREIKVRARLLEPDPRNPDELRWAREGSCKISELDAYRDRQSLLLTEGIL